jgi:two-component system response regulator (stage 0 sporulation protein A)
MENFKIILADSDFNNAYKTLDVLNNKGYRSICLVKNLEQIEKTIDQTKQIDLLVLDAELNNLNLLKFIAKHLDDKNKIRTVVLATFIKKNEFINHFYRSGVDFVIEKPFKVNDLLTVLEILHNQHYRYISNFQFSPKATNQIRIFSKDILDEFKFKKGLSGYLYLLTSFDLVFKDNRLTEQITKSLYPEIAQIHRTDSKRVERAIRYSLNNVLKRGESQVIKEKLKIEIDANNNITNLEFIVGVVEWLKRVIIHL